MDVNRWLPALKATSVINANFRRNELTCQQTSDLRKASGEEGRNKYINDVLPQSDKSKIEFIIFNNFLWLWNFVYPFY